MTAKTELISILNHFIQHENGSVSARQLSWALDYEGYLIGLIAFTLLILVYFYFILLKFPEWKRINYVAITFVVSTVLATILVLAHNRGKLEVRRTIADLNNQRQVFRKLYGFDPLIRDRYRTLGTRVTAVIILKVQVYQKKPDKTKADQIQKMVEVANRFLDFGEIKLVPPP